jgi:DNA-3-methyladenine glycosylase I
MKRCPWVPEGDQLYENYHDKEWGVPVHDDRKHFEFLVLEGAQAGLSWRTVLGKRAEYGKAFKLFNPKFVSKFTARDLARMLKNTGLIRNRAKLNSAINNAKHFLEIQKEFGSFDKYVWKFVGKKPITHRIRTLKDYPVTSPEAIALSVDLKKRGFTFVGPTVIYAHLQATGLVNDHSLDCFKRKG